MSHNRRFTTYRDADEQGSRRGPSGKIAHSCLATDGVQYDQVNLSTQTANDRRHEASQHVGVDSSRLHSSRQEPEPILWPVARSAYVSGLELGQRNPTVVTLWHITKALEVTLKMFFDEDKPRRRVSRGKN
jgi:hypothetical protein